MSPLVTACDKSEQIDLFIYVTQSWQYQQYFLISFTYMYTKKPAFIYQFATPMLILVNMQSFIQICCKLIKIWNPKGFNMSPREDKRKQKKCEINKKVHYSIETQQDFWSERKIARRVEHLSYTKVTSICLQKSIYLIIKNNYSSYSSMLLNWRGFDLQDAQDQFYTQSLCSSTKGITSMQFSLPLNWHLTGKK